ncbi:hypothetical protein E4U53_002262 [Claviceps sorghi]|nr:hypothetical protein E4U53_002262 [Claviceps sorghi]
MDVDPSPPRQFDDAFSTTSHFFFYNTVDPSTASLTSNILGPNLTATFTHSRAAALLPPATILSKLTRKTTGFLAFLPPAGTATRTIVAWAESGHGHGPEGDLLDDAPAVLPNAVWARRVIHLSSIMGLPLGHPFDRLTRGGHAGIFRASHVEVKLAAHAIHTLLRMHKVRPRGDALTLAALATLRRTLGAHAPRFEIYFSKRNCHACAAFVARLGELTGVHMALCWRERLVRIEYGVTSMGEAAVVHDGDDDDDDVRVLDSVDLTREHDAPGLPSADVLEGLAYCIGQGGGAHVARAVFDLARMRRRR